MRSFLKSICIFLLLVTFAAAQTTPAKSTPGKSEKSTTAESSNLPSEATVDSFLHQQFGYETDLTWKISSIKPSTVNGLAEDTVVLPNPQGSQLTPFFVPPGGKPALVGQNIPFGAKPFDLAKQRLEKGVNGP